MNNIKQLDDMIKDWDTVLEQCELIYNKEINADGYSDIMKLLYNRFAVLRNKGWSTEQIKKKIYEFTESHIAVVNAATKHYKLIDADRDFMMLICPFFTYAVGFMSSPLSDDVFEVRDSAMAGSKNHILQYYEQMYERFVKSKDI